MGKQKHRELNQSQLKGSAFDNRHVPSRVAKRNSSGKKPKKNRNFLLPSLFFTFILIPVAILIYVAFVYEPDDMLQTSANENEVSVETNTNPPGSDSVVAGDQDDSEDTEDTEGTEDADAEANAAKEAAAKKKAEQEKAEKEQAAKEQAEKEQAAKEQAAKEQAEREAAERAQAEKEAREEAEKKASQRTHTVQESETLYRIAVNYYGTGDAVDKIKAANGLASNEISVGQTLILP